MAAGPRQGQRGLFSKEADGVGLDSTLKHSNDQGSSSRDLSLPCIDCRERPTVRQYQAHNNAAPSRRRCIKVVDRRTGRAEPRAQALSQSRYGWLTRLAL